MLYWEAQPGLRLSPLTLQGLLYLNHTKGEWNKMNRLLSVVSMGLARRWKAILMFLGAWWIITSFLMNFLQMGTFSTFGTYFPNLLDNEIAIILLLIGIGYIVEQFRLESQLGLTRKEQIESLFIQTLVDSGIITLIYALLIPLRSGFH